ncbi:heavy-metal-associated domain-containing protein [Roseomonas sp. KE2513]|uniref:heavy-metal-associated domain-containing protein n=1 Tax=Roseomonas sp. KE2513 TaxID=2479202 RepID=UPI0018DFC920|nr:heavy metal-associated domain-containing protein [Roseomonas sp. KE2513]MBI0539683.1 heavy-metal-associated domain-containing protein [Roseomonas sp. KE2513]
MTNRESTTSGTQVDLRYLVHGMDCTSCALKIEDAVEQLGGAEDIQVNYKTQVLELRLDEATTPRAAVEEKIQGLGYRVAPLV